MNREVIVGYDGSPPGRAAVEWAAEQCRAERTRLTICQIWAGPYASWAEATAIGERRLASRCLAEGVALAERLLPGREIRPVLLRGDPREELISLSRDASALVVGHRGLGGVAGLVLGSVSAHAAAHASCPVVVVRAGGGVDDPRGGVVVGVDSSPSSRAAMEFAARTAAGRGLPLRVVHALGEATGAPTADRPEAALLHAHRRDADRLDADRARADGARADGACADRVAEAERMLAELVEPWLAESWPAESRPALPGPAVPGLAASRGAGRRSRIAITACVVRERPLPALLSYRGEARLIVVGSRGAGGVRARLLGSVSQGLLHHAACSVAVVKPPVTATGH
ncbi:universal stress protein [Planotetraspora sp. A-T 1434]|uniref:universal stress protein n=1 Tax=Planotetraspora sp. A-T 1434 TaxID=2979219 RepID=UPI0021C1FBA4|nr:universal stress protein [Planotetraspora sp. A-T 1434]MCT9932168.1 universal stress protein [Planotetraspora sp. A-T 1434]